MCHGGRTKNWGSVTNNAQCTVCHGMDWTTTGYQLVYAAPGYGTIGHDVWGSVGALSGGVSNNPQVGAHDAHLRGLNTIAQAVACVQCHTVPATANSGNHNNTLRRAEITWGSIARANAAAATWFTNPYQCSNVYCHGGAMPKGDTSGANRNPIWWNTGGYLVNPVNTYATTIQGGCGTCHGAPPTGGSSAATHANKTLNECNQCHPHVAVGGAISTVSLHMDGVLQAVTGCNGCHSYDTSGGTWGAGSGSGLWGSTNAWGAHAKHIDFLKLRNLVSLDATTNVYGNVAPFNQVCGVCHSQNRTADHGNDGGLNTRNINFNGSNADVFGAQPLPVWTSTTGVRSCSNLDCHYKATPQW
jgi:hypothetical protein